MDPQTNGAPGLTQSPQPGSIQTTMQSGAAPVAAPPMSTVPQTPTVPPQTAPHATAHTPLAPSASSASPTTAADNDIIEPEWVSRAKRVVSDNKYDPYKQVQAMNLLRADYMKKRYGRDIGVPGA